MEFVWMIPLYIIIPTVGIILLFSGFNFTNQKRIVRFAIGILLLALPIAHKILERSFEKRNEQAVVGHYSLENDTLVVLTLNPDKTFELSKVDSLEIYGTGQWEFKSWDIDELILNFKDSVRISLEIFHQDKGRYLVSYSGYPLNHTFPKLVQLPAGDSAVHE